MIGGAELVVSTALEDELLVLVDGGLFEARPLNFLYFFGRIFFVAIFLVDVFGRQGFVEVALTLYDPLRFQQTG